MCWFDVDFQNNSKVTEVLGPRPLTYMCPPPLQKGVKYSFCEPLNTCIYIHKIKLVDLFPHTILKLLLYHMTWTIKHCFRSRTVTYNELHYHTRMSICPTQQYAKSGFCQSITMFNLESN